MKLPLHHFPQSTSDTFVFRCRGAAKSVKRMSPRESRPHHRVDVPGFELAVRQSVSNRN
jgi:hypothetical protein